MLTLVVRLATCPVAICNNMEIAMPKDTSFMVDIHKQLVARNAVEVHAFAEITGDYQRCLDQLRELRVRQPTTQIGLKQRANDND